MAVTANTWLGATTGVLPAAAQQQAFLGVHKVQMLYAGVVGASQTTAGTGTTNSNGLYIAQSFTTGASQTTVGYVLAEMGSLSASGSLLPPLVLGLYASSAGAPTGPALATMTAPAEYVNPAPTLTVFPLPVSGLSPSTTYWLVTQPVGSVSYNYEWQKSNQTSGTSTSTNGTTWTAQTYGSVFSVYDQTASGPLTAVWEDSGARWQALYYTATNEITALGQYTVAQNANYVAQYRSFTYTSGLLQGVA